jgi:ABC-2 type transport system ATP-binding protein
VNTPAIATEALTRDYGPVRALDSLNLRVEPGEIFGFLGPNGAGKTTTIRVLLDLIRPNAGRASILGFDCQRQSMDVRRRTGYLPGDLYLYDGLTGAEFLRFFSSLRPGTVDPAYLRKLLERLDLDPSKKVRAYSKGNRQKLGLVQALMHQPEVLMLDEPTSGLDPLVQHEVWLILEEVASEGRTVFLSSHVLSEVERICHRVGIIRTGRLVAVEEVATLKARALHIIEVTFAEAVPEAAFAVPGVEVLQHEDSKVRMQVRDHLDDVIKMIARYPVVDLRTEQAGLEEVFLAFYEEEARTEKKERVPA